MVIHHSTDSENAMKGQIPSGNDTVTAVNSNSSSYCRFTVPDLVIHHGADFENATKVLAP